MIIEQVNGFKLYKQNDEFFYIKDPNGNTSVDTAGTKEELINELERWKSEIDFNNKFMLEIENKFIDKLNYL